ncbi:MAG: hypothetical protein RIE77_05915 [Phycisphaerales bacterium]|jgi:hypothetical protein
MPWRPRSFKISGLRRWLIIGALSAIAIFSLAGVVAFSLSEQAPAWWRTVRRDDPRTEQTAIAIENGLWNALYQRREPGQERWHVWVGANDANAWLNTTMRDWVAAQWELVGWPQELEEVQVEFMDGFIAIGLRVGMPDGVRYISAVVEPIIDEDGALWLPARTVSVGRLTLPAGVLLDYLRRNQEEYVPPALLTLPETKAIFSALEGNAPLIEDASQSLGDGRRVSLIAMRPVGARLELWCMTSQDADPDDGDDLRRVRAQSPAAMAVQREQQDPG